MTKHFQFQIGGNFCFKNSAFDGSNNQNQKEYNPFKDNSTFKIYNVCTFYINLNKTHSF